MIYLSTSCAVVLDVERPPKNYLNEQLIPTKCIHFFCGLWCLKKDVISYPKNISAVKKGKAKEVNDLKV